MDNKYKLINRFIDLEFTTEETKFTNVVNKGKTISFKCPTWGMKPNIAISMNLLPTGNTSDVTIKCMNMYSEINIAKYKYVHVKAGYKGSLYQEFSAEIKNSYIERPNPEGITIFNCVFGTVSQMYDVKEPVTVEFAAGMKVSAAIYKAAVMFDLKVQMYLPEEWKDVVYNYSSLPYTKAYRNALEMWSDIKTQLRVISEAFRLTPIYTSVTGNTFYVVSMLAGSDKEKSVVLDKVTTAYVTGGSIVVKAPWLPTLMPSSLFKMDTRFFRGRMGSLQVGGDKKLFRAFSIKVGFSTYSENYMEVNATDLSISGDWA